MYHGCCNSRRIFFFNAIPNRFQIRLLSYETIFKTIISKRCKLKRIISFEFRHVKLAEKKGHEKTRGDFVAISQAVYAHLPCSARCRSHSEIPSSPTRVTFVLDLRSNTWLLPRISYILDCKNSNRDTARLEQPDDPISKRWFNFG